MTVELALDMAEAGYTVFPVLHTNDNEKKPLTRNGHKDATRDPGVIMEWRAVIGYEGLYEVSNTGQVRSLDRQVTPRSGRGKGVSYLVKGVVLKQATQRSGHKSVSLSNGEAVKWLVHRLVLIAFKGPPPAGQEGCHNDGNPGNNALGNLRWATSSENHLDKVRHGNHRNARKTSCKRGHPFVEGNIRPRANSTSNSRICWACVKESNLAYNQRRPFDLERANKNFEQLMKGRN